MITATEGWAMVVPGDTNPSPGSGARVVRTTDGGLYWTTVLHNEAQPIAADFHDSTHAWVLELLGGYSTASSWAVVVASTSDGGRSWRASPRLNVNGAARHLQFLDASYGWVFATPSAGGVIGSQDTTLYRTTDGGVHWQVIKPASQVRNRPDVLGTLPEACPGGVPITAPSFIDRQTGWLGARCNRLFFYTTRDGGLSWTAQDLLPFPGPGSGAAPPAEPTYVTASPRFVSLRDGVTFIHRGVTTGANALQDVAIYVTHDAGTSWAASRLPALELAAEFIDAQHGWMVATPADGLIEARSLYATADGGRSWRFVSGPQDFFNRELSFVSQTIGFVANPAVKEQPGQLLKTTDGGANWTSIPFSID